MEAAGPVQSGAFAIEALTGAADSEIWMRRTHRLIRACDPECYRRIVSVNGGIRIEQAGRQVPFGARDVVLYDLSQPGRSTHLAGSAPTRVVMLALPRALVPI